LSLEALIDDSTFKQGLQLKADKLPEELKSLVTDVTFIVDENVKRDRKLGGPMPVVTSNLQGSISIDNLSDYQKRLFPDEGIAPYVIYVLKGVRGKKQVTSIDFLAEGVELAQPAVDARLEEFKSWIME